MSRGNNDDQRLLEIIQRVRELQIEQQTLETEARIIRRRRQQQNRNRRRRPVPLRTDVNGTEIGVGDRVRFLTRGRYNSTQGRIVRFTDRFVVSEDNQGNRINREYGNVVLITDNDEQ